MVCVYIYIYVWRYVCLNSSACHAYVMWAELGHCHFLYVPAVLNIVTTGNGTGTKNVLNGTMRMGLSLVPVFCLRRYYFSETKPILYLDKVHCNRISTNSFLWTFGAKLVKAAAAWTIENYLVVWIEFQCVKRDQKIPLQLCRCLAHLEWMRQQADFVVICFN